MMRAAGRLGDLALIGAHFRDEYGVANALGD